MVTRGGPHCTDMTTDSQRNTRGSYGERLAGKYATSGAATVAPTPMDGWLGPILVSNDLITQEQLVELPADAVWTGCVEAELSTDAAIAAAVAKRFRLLVADLRAADPRMATLVPESLARKHRVLPLSANDRTIQIASADPRDLDLEQTLRFVTGREVVFQVAAPAALMERLDEIYRPERAIERLLGGLEPARVEAVEESAAPSAKERELEAPVAKLVDAMISDAVREGASDIHAEPTQAGVVVRYRVDGVLREVMRLPDAAGSALVRRVKIWAKLDVTDPLRPHDGRASARVDGQSVDLRVSTIPVARRGEKVVIRILDTNNLCGSLSELGLPDNELSLLAQLLGHRNGMVLVTGPTGSGKTTTLYAALNELKTGKVNIVTVEDPVEYDVQGISQIQVSETQGLTFATALRSVLRQDPDIVLVGEIRDLETATTAVQAGFSGHFVLSTLHTNDAPSAVARLRDMGVDAFKIASVLKGVVAQRLVRRLCDACAEPVDVSTLPAETRPPADRAGVRVRKAAGCRQCNGRGYRGRLPVFEVMPVDETVARLTDAGALPDAPGAGRPQTRHAHVVGEWPGTGLGRRHLAGRADPRHGRAGDRGTHARLACGGAGRAGAGRRGPSHPAGRRRSPDAPAHRQRAPARRIHRHRGVRRARRARPDRARWRGPGHPRHRHAATRRARRARGAARPGAHRIAARDRSDRTARRRRGKSPGSRRPGLSDQAGAGPFTGGPRPGRPETRKRLMQ